MKEKDMLYIYVIYINIYKCITYLLDHGKESAAIWETRVRSLSWEVPLKKRIATHSSILAWRIPWTEEPGGLQSMGLQRIRHD